MVKVLRTAFFILFPAFLFLLFFELIEIEDIWWHISTGRWIFDNGQVPHQDIFSFTDEKVPWIFTQWLGSCFYYLVYQAGGLFGLKLFRALFFISIIGIFLSRYYRKIPLSLLAIVLYCLANCLFARNLLRPFIFNFLFIQLLLIILIGFIDDQNAKRLFLIPLIGILWVNIHLGSLVYGTILISTFMFSKLIQWANIKIGKTPGDLNDRTAKTAGQLFILLCFYFIIFLINPYGIEGALYPFRVFIDPRHIGFYSLIGRFVEEMHPPAFSLTLGGSWIYVLFVLGALAVIFNKKERFIVLLLYLVALFIFLYGKRGIGYFALISAYVIAEAAVSTQLFNKWGSKRYQKAADGLVFIILCFIMISGMTNALTIKIYQKQKFSSVVKTELNPYNPRSSLEFLKANNLKGRIFNDAMFGGYFIWAAYPQIRPFTDSRQLNQRLYRANMAVLNNPERNWPVIERQYGIDIVTSDAANPLSLNFISYLKGRPDWQLAFLDGSQVIFLKKGKFQLAEHIGRFEDTLNSKHLNTEHYMMVKDNLRSEHIPEINLIYMDVLEEAVTLLSLGFRGASLEKFVEASEISSDSKTRGTIERALAFFRTGNK